MSTVVGIGIGRHALSAACIDSAGIPCALGIGDGADSLRRHLLSITVSGKKSSGSAALYSVLKQPGIQLDQVTCVQSAGNVAIQLLSEALAHAHAHARAAIGSQAPIQFTIALDADCEFRAEHVREAAARSMIPVSAVIDRASALRAYLRWWLPGSVQRCRLLSVECDGRVSSAFANRSTGGSMHVQGEQAVRSLPAMLSLHSGLRSALEAQLGPATRKGAEILDRIAEQLLLECLGTDGAGARKSECVQHVRGKEMVFALPDTAVAQLLEELADTVRTDRLDDADRVGPVDATILSCAFLSEDLRARLLEACGAQPLLLPRNAQACLAFGAALAGTARQADDVDPPCLPGAIGVHAGDRRDTARQRFVPLLEAGTPLPAEARRNFYARGGSRNRLLFAFVLRASPIDRPIGQILLPVHESNGAHHEVHLRLSVSATGDCRYALLDERDAILVDGFIGSIDLAASAAPVAP